MKPLVATSGMKEGSMNEVHVLRALPSYFESLRGLFAKSRPEDFGLDSRGFRFFEERKLSVEFIRATGLAASKSNIMLTDSPDPIFAMKDTDGARTGLGAAVEVNKMNSLKTIEEVKAIAEQFGPICVLTDIRSDANILHRFKKVIPSSGYMSQCIQHAAVHGVRHVLYVVGKCRTNTPTRTRSVRGSRRKTPDRR